jgi:hypothetical protein
MHETDMVHGAGVLVRQVGNLSCQREVVPGKQSRWRGCIR